MPVLSLPFGVGVILSDPFTIGPGGVLSDPFTITPVEDVALPAVGLAVSRQPIGGAAGQPFDTALVVSAINALGHVVPGEVHHVTLELTTLLGGPAVLGGTSARDTAGGSILFDDLTVSAGGSYAITASAPGLASVTTDGFTIAATRTHGARAATDAQRSLVAARGYNLDVIVEVMDAAGAWQDLTDWFDTARWRDSADAAIMDGTVTFLRDSADDSLAPLMTSAPMNNPGGAYSPAIDGTRGVRVKAAYTAPGVDPVPGDYVEVFLGAIDEPDWGGRDSNTVSCIMRDIGAWLLKKWTEEEAEYGSDTGMLLEGVMQQILDANVNPKLAAFANGANGINATTGAVTLYVPVSPGVVIPKKVTAPVGPVLNILRDLAAQTGQDVRFKYDAAGNFRLTLFTPPRNKVTPDGAFGPDEYFDVPGFSIPTTDVRNILDLYYTDAGGAQQSVHKENGTSIGLYGPMYHRIALPSGSPVTTATLATALANAVDSDLSLPYALQQVLTNFAWFVGIGDLYTFEANDVLYDQPQNMAVTQLEHVLEQGDGSTTMSTRGRPIGRRGFYLAAGDTGAPSDFVLTDLPTLDVKASADALHYTITYVSLSPVVEVAINGGAYSTAPASPLLVDRPAAGSAPLEYSFRVTTADGYVTDSITVQPIGSTDTDTVTPDLSVIPVATAATNQQFTASATNPKTAAAVGVYVTVRGTTATDSASNAYADGVEALMPVGATLTVNRPVFATVAGASVTFRSTIAGGGTERIQRSIPTQVKTSFGPSLDVVPTPFADHYSIAYAGAGGTVELSINGAAYGAPPASPFLVNRPAAGSTPLSYTFRIIADSQTITDSVDIQPIGGSTTDTNTVTPDLYLEFVSTTDTVVWFRPHFSNPGGAPAPACTITLKGVTAIIAGAAYGDGAVVAVNDGADCQINRPTFGGSNTANQPSVQFRATIAGGGAETISRTILPQVKTTFGPSLQVSASSDSTNTTITYTWTGVLELSIDNGAYGSVGASPLVIPRDTVNHTYAFRATADGQTVPGSVTVPALPPTTTVPPPGHGSFTAISQGLLSAAFDQVRFTWTWSGSDAYFQVYVAESPNVGDESEPQYIGDTSTNDSHYDYNSGADLNGTNTIDPSTTIRFYLRAMTAGGGGLIAQSTESSHTYGTN